MSSSGADRWTRGAQLLVSCLSRNQREQFVQHRFFDVIGGESGKRYRIRHGRSQNVDEMDGSGRRAWQLCFYPLGALVTEEVMLGQKLALELFEADALKIARRVSTGAGELARLYAEHHRMFLDA